jgi:hypothetical protein
MLGVDRVSGCEEERAKGRHHLVASLGCTWASCARACVVAVKVHPMFFAAALGKRAVMVAGERGNDGNLQTDC